MTPQIIHWWLYGAHIILYYSVRSFIFTHEQLSFLYIYNSECSDQLTRTTINPRAYWTSCKPNGYVRYCGGDRHAQRRSNPGAEKENKSLSPLGHDLKCARTIILMSIFPASGSFFKKTCFFSDHLFFLSIVIFH